jgi:hypothetical protein
VKSTKPSAITAAPSSSIGAGLAGSGRHHHGARALDAHRPEGAPADLPPGRFVVDSHRWSQSYLIRLMLFLRSSSHGFRLTVSLPKALKARSRPCLSQTLRPSIRTGFGILPSATNSSNFPTLIPMYWAAASRLSPRGGRFTGRASYRGMLYPPRAPSTWDLQIDGKRDRLIDARRYA